MASTTAHTIIIQSNNPDNMAQRIHESPCQAAVTIVPGMLLDWGTTNTVKPHATAGGNAVGRKVAVENPWSDHGSGQAIDHAYAAGESVGYIDAAAGDVLYMFLETAANVAKGAPLQSNGAGALEAHVAGAVEGIIGYAYEALNNATGSNARIRVEIA